MVATKEYPDDAIPFYAQGFSLVEYLLERGREFSDSEHHRLVRFAGAAMQSGDWQSALHEHYGIPNLGELQTSWVAWVGSDSRSFPVVAAAPTAVVASVAPPILQAHVLQAHVSVPVVQTSAKPLPPPVGKSVYDQQVLYDSQVGTIPTKWNDERPVQVHWGQNVVLR